MVSERFTYNTYGHGRTRPMSREEAHWKDLGVRLGLRMRKPRRDPAHRSTPDAGFKGGLAFRRGKQAMAAFMTPQPPC